jgi:hypothetical protein
MPINLQPEDYPARIEAFLPDGTVVWSAIVEAGTRLYVPPLSREHRSPIGIRVTYPDGTVMETGPPK